MVNYQSRNVASGDMFSYYSTDYQSNINIQEIKKEINNMVIRPRYRFHILNEDETVKEDIPEIDIISGGSYNENYQNGQRRSISLTLFNEDGRYTPSINNLWSGTKISFEMGLEFNDNTLLWFPKGIYVISSINPSHQPTSKTVNIELNDKFAILEGADGTLETTYTIPAGIEIRKIITDILNTDKGNGFVIDPKNIVYNNAFYGAKTQATITKEAGDNFGSIILDLATQLNAEVFYDINGNLNFVPINDVTQDEDKPVIFSFFSEYGDIFNNNMSFDLNGIVNRVIVIGGTINGGICKAVAVNDNAISPLCYQRIGYKTASPINDSNITSDALAKERADYELRKRLILKSSVSTSVAYNPLLLVNNLINITDEFYDMVNEQFLIQNISCSLDYSGVMSMSCSNIRNLMFTTTKR